MCEGFLLSLFALKRCTAAAFFHRDVKMNDLAFCINGSESTTSPRVDIRCSSACGAAS